MKEKIIAAIKEKFPAVNLSKKRLDAIAATLEDKVTDETQIDAKLDEFNIYNPFTEIARNDDAMRNMEAKLKSKQEPPPAPPPGNDEKLDMLKQLSESIKALTEKVSGFEAEKTKGSIRTKVTDQLKDIPASYWGKRALPEKDEDIETFVEDVKSDFTSFTKEITEAGIALHPLPSNGSGRVRGEKAASKEEIDAVVNEIM